MLHNFASSGEKVWPGKRGKQEAKRGKQEAKRGNQQVKRGKQEIKRGKQEAIWEQEAIWLILIAMLHSISSIRK